MRGGDCVIVVAAAEGIGSNCCICCGWNGGLRREGSFVRIGSGIVKVVPSQ